VHSYSLPHRIYVARVYPIRATNGSTIVVYGSEQGVTVSWRGGRPLESKSEALPAKPPLTNGTGKEDAIMLDSDDDEPPHTQNPVEPAKFEETEEGYDPSEPYPPIVQQWSLALGADALDIAFPAMARSTEKTPVIFHQRIVIAVTCSDCSVRVISLPLTPPSDAAVAHHQVHESISTLSGHLGHQETPTSVSITWTPRTPLAEEMEEDAENDEDADERPTLSRRRQSRLRMEEQREFDLVVASHSADLGGVLKLSRVPIESYGAEQTTLSGSFAQVISLYTRTPATKLHFNTSSYPSRRHSQLLFADTRGILKVYDALSSSIISTFSTPFTPSGQRKRLIDVNWTSDGRSMIALLEDGEWGVWVVDPAGLPSNQNNGTRTFVCSGYAGAEPGSSSSSTSSSDLAPMTPKTRRVKEEALFTAPSPSTSRTSHRGGISVLTKPSLHSRSERDESVILWFDDRIYTSRGSVASNEELSLARYDGLDLHGELLNNVDQFPQPSGPTASHDLLIAAEHRYIVLGNTKSSDFEEQRTAGAQVRTEEDDDPFVDSDRSRLATGVLDLDGMDRMLDGMGQASKRFVGFAT